ncbi:VWA domain-containing protein [Tunturiibacter gelidoferens]|uniref:VWFA-related protein n=1 Tax=Tunturiibacter gelidiferens TaxID=3069689 RepID=A0ACC5NTQ4_9BACT|nr:VWA domain-containing protein [Edaphobacter lichenicola]MBB5337904.1 VWFA-related protein [Edaphobacter lichenicola]
MLSKLPLLFLLPLTASLAQTTSQAPQPTQSVATLRAHTQLVVVDVVVTDKSQNPVRNLKASDFTLLESGQPQQIKSFEEHGDPSGTAATKPMPVNSPGIFSNYSPAPSDAVNVLLVDTLNTPVTDQIYLHDQFRKYIKTAKPGVPTAIFGLTTKLLFLQSFTSDPELLKAAIDNKNIAHSPLIERVTGGNTTQSADQMSETVATSGVTAQPGSTAFMQQVIADLKQFDAQQNSFQSQLRAKYTLDAINQLARFLSGIPGRKNLIWFSGSFPLDVLPDGSINDPFTVVASSEAEYRETTNLLTRAQVAVYPIDARGAMTSPNMDISQSTSIYLDDAKRFNADEVKYHLTAGAENLTMLRMADDSGGHAFINTNDLVDAINKATAAGSHYYTLTYSPTDSKWNGNFRKIQVKVQQSGLNLAYRRGYFADDPDISLQPHHRSGKASATAAPPVDPMHVAMMHGAPDSTQITLKVRVLPTSKARETDVAKGNTLNPSSDMKGPYRRYAIDIAADPYSIHTEQASDGNYHAELQFLTYVYDRNGSLLNMESDPVRANFSPDLYKQILHSGLPYRQEISVPLKGDFYLRIGIHDLVTNRIGSLEVPIGAVKDLPPLPASAATETPPAPSPEK